MLKSPVRIIPVQPSLIDITDNRVVFDDHSPIGGVYLKSGEPVNLRRQIKEKQGLAVDLYRAASRFKDAGKTEKSLRLMELAKDYTVQTTISHRRFIDEKWTTRELAQFVAAGGEVLLQDQFPETLRWVIVNYTRGLRLHQHGHYSSVHERALKTFFEAKLLALGKSELKIQYIPWSNGNSTFLIQHEDKDVLKAMLEAFNNHEWEHWPKASTSGEN